MSERDDFSDTLKNESPIREIRHQPVPFEFIEQAVPRAALLNEERDLVAEIGTFLRQNRARFDGIDIGKLPDLLETLEQEFLDQYEDIDAINTEYVHPEDLFHRIILNALDLCVDQAFEQQPELFSDLSFEVLKLLRTHREKLDDLGIEVDDPKFSNFLKLFLSVSRANRIPAVDRTQIPGAYLKPKNTKELLKALLAASFSK